MLCNECRRQVPRRAPHCPSCGAPRGRGRAVYDLVLPDGSVVPIVRELSLGRAPGNAIELTDPSVSRRHARLSPSGSDGEPVLQDLGSSAGTWAEGTRLNAPLAVRDGTKVRLGDSELAVYRRRSRSEAGRTILVPAGASLVERPGGAAVESVESRVGLRPRLRHGYALKRLDASQGTRRWIVKSLGDGRMMQVAGADVQLLRLLDGRHTIPELVTAAEQQLGPAGSTRLARLLADLGAHDLLAGAQPPTEARPRGILRPRRRTLEGAGELFDRAYRRAGWLLFTAPILLALAAVAAAGLAAFAYLVGARYGTPFVVANKLALGGIVFFLGRLAVAAVHEAAHGLAMASFGRRVGEAGIKVVLVFPYVYVDTSDAWFESRRRRIAVSAAGPVSDLTLGGAFALACLALPAGATRDVCFQLAFGAYLGALLNLNPLLDRDGYHILVDLLREPGLRGRALAQLRGRLAGRDEGPRSPLLARYALLTLAWMLIAAVSAAAFSLRYEQALAAVVPPGAAWGLLAVLWLALLALPLAIVVPSLRERRRAVGT
jgi:putative peptide zinc metalloprotease protein